MQMAATGMLLLLPLVSQALAYTAPCRVCGPAMRKWPVQPRNAAVRAESPRLLLTASDDGRLRLSDLRSARALATHRLRRAGLSLAIDAHRAYVGCDDGVLRSFDYSARGAERASADELAGSAGGVGGGFTERQRAALALALESQARRRQ